MIVAYAGETGGTIEIASTLSGVLIATIFSRQSRQTIPSSGNGTHVRIAKRYIGVLSAGIYTLLLEGVGNAQYEDLHILPTHYRVRNR